MSEHAIYSKLKASPVHAIAGLWSSSPEKAAGSSPSVSQLAYGRPAVWSFRTVRHLAAAGLVDMDDAFLGTSETASHQRFQLGTAETTVVAGLRSFVRNADGETASEQTDIKHAAPKVSALDIYNRHFGLKQRPFSLVPDPEFLYWATEHQHAYAALEYGVLTKAPITLITGEIGAGKTTLVQELLQTMGEGLKIGLVSNMHGSPKDLLRWVLMALGQPTLPDATHPELTDALQAYVISEYSRGNRVVLIFDEAQNLTLEALEELRLLTNINSNKDELLQLVLVGQPELRQTINRPELCQFAQRVAASFHLTAMDAQTVRAYIAHRLRIAGLQGNIFSEAATDLIFEATAGIPRQINQLCDLAMVYAFTNGQKSVVRFTVQQVLDDGSFFGANLARARSDAGKKLVAAE